MIHQVSVQADTTGYVPPPVEDGDDEEVWSVPDSDSYHDVKSLLGSFLSVS